MLSATSNDPWIHCPHYPTYPYAHYAPKPSDPFPHTLSPILPPHWPHEFTAPWTELSPSCPSFPNSLPSLSHPTEPSRAPLGIQTSVQPSHPWVPLASNFPHIPFHSHRHHHLQSQTPPPLIPSHLCDSHHLAPYGSQEPLSLKTPSKQFPSLLTASQLWSRWGQKCNCPFTAVSLPPSSQHAHSWSPLPPTFHIQKQSWGQGRICFSQWQSPYQGRPIPHPPMPSFVPPWLHFWFSLLHFLSSAAMNHPGKGHYSNLLLCLTFAILSCLWLLH